MQTKRKNKKKIGISLLILAAVLVPVASAAKKKQPEVYAVISGSVFQESGFALPGAPATLVAEGQKMETASDARGEFIFRVPPGPRQYSLTVGAKGYQNLRKSVSVQAEERVEVTFQLERESK
jgi:Carboxypeptidase regulatory-like domain